MKGSAFFDHDDGDCIALAFARERAWRQVRVQPVAHECAFKHTFQCVCCGRRRSKQERQSADSEVCMRCVRAAGFQLTE
jgi:hypothetical protein